MSELALRPLPGVRFETQPASLDDPLPRMDVAVFAGFAASGPLDWPVAVESLAAFRAVFGDDVPLAWDDTRDELQYSLLGPAVRQYFANGGRRCWIIRVAGEGASYNYFPVPGLLLARFDRAGQVRAVAPAFARASARGAYSDALRLRSALSERHLPLADPWDGERWLKLGAGQALPVVGDVVCLRDEARGVVVLAAVVALDGAAGPLRARLGHRLAFERMAQSSPPLGRLPGRAWVYSAARVPAAGRGLLPAFGHLHPLARRAAAWLDAALDGAGRAALRLRLPPERAPGIGTWLRFDAGGEHWWCAVEQVALDGGWVRVSGTMWRRLHMDDAVALLRASQAATAASVLSLTLRAELGGQAVTLAGLGLADGHARYWNDLPSDDEYYRGDPPATGLPRFALAGAEKQRTLCLPLAVPALFSAPLGAVRQGGSALARNGLASFDASLFLDRDLAGVSSERLMSEADRLRYLDPAPRALRGLHAALGWADSAIIDEATLIAVPDAVHRRWRMQAPPAAVPPLDAPLIAHPEWWHDAACPLPSPLPLIDAPPSGPFLDCAIRVIAPPGLAATPPDALGTLTVSWSQPEDRLSFVLQEANRPDFGDAREVYRGEARQATFYGRPVGDYYYRVRALSGINGSHWSAPVAVHIGALADAVFEPPADYDDSALRTVHIALLRLGAGRGDFFASLSLPRHYREAQAIGHASLLRRAGDGFDPRFLGGTEAAALSFGALYHPWALSHDEQRLAAAPPDGLALAQLALRAAERGAWIAPANIVLRDVVALDPSLPAESRQALLNAQVNLLRQEARGFLALAADTLSLDPDWRPINVRRLISLLRRVALQRGSHYVFEPLSDAFRRSVARGFEALMNELFRRGAFAGVAANQAYQVNVGLPPNTAHDLDNGRFFVELKVAPAIPLAFLSVRLVQLGDRLLTSEVH